MNDSKNPVGGLSSYPYSLCLKFSPPNKDVYIAAVNYEDIAKWRDILSFHCRRHVDANTLMLKTTNNIYAHSTSSSKLNTNTNSSNFSMIPNQQQSSTTTPTTATTTLTTVSSVPPSSTVNKNNNTTSDKANTMLNYKSNNLTNTDDFDDIDADDDDDCDDCDDEKNTYEDIEDVDADTNENDSLNEIKYCPSKSNSNYYDSNSNNNSNSNGKHSDNGESNGRRLSYKEDDIIRKQRLKENLNQLLIEYKHEEEAHLKKSSKFSLTNSNHSNQQQQQQQQLHQTSNNMMQNNTLNKNRTSLDSCYSNMSLKYNTNANNKPSDYSIVLNNNNNNSNNNNSSQSKNNQANTNSAFRTVVPATSSALQMSSSHSKPTQIIENKSFSKLSAHKPNNLSSSSSSQTTNKMYSTGSNKTSTISSPNERYNIIDGNHDNTNGIQTSSSSKNLLTTNNNNNGLNSMVSSNQDQLYKKPCLISPRKMNNYHESNEAPSSNNNNVGSTSNNKLAINEDNSSYSSSSILTTSSVSSNSSTVMSSSQPASHSNGTTNNLQLQGLANKSLTILVKNGANSTTSSNGTLTNNIDDIHDSYSPNAKKLQRTSQSKLSASVLGSPNGNSCNLKNATTSAASTTTIGSSANSPNSQYNQLSTLDKLSNKISDSLQIASSNSKKISNEEIHSKLLLSQQKFKSNVYNSNSNSNSNSSAPKRSSVNISSYLIKIKDPSHHFNHMLNDQHSQGEKYWFSLNSNLCCLMYWKDKYEQDIGKFPIGKFDFAKCCTILTGSSMNGHQSEHIDNNLFKISFHQNAMSITLKANSFETKLNWCESLKYMIENLANNCVRCSKPKLIVNPMPLISSSSTSLPSSDEPHAQLPPSSSSSSSSSQNKQTNITLTLNTNSSPLGAKSSAYGFTQSMNNENEHHLHHQQQQQQQHHHYEMLKNQCEKLIDENNEITSKFKLLEQIHLDTINEYDKQQNRLISQLDDMHLKNNRTETDLENLTKRFNQIKHSYESSLTQVKQLSDQLNKLRDSLDLKDKELDKLNMRVSQMTSEQQKLAKSSSSQGYGVSSDSSSSSQQEKGWNKEVKILDSRINDVLSKLKEREISLVSSSDESLRIKCEALQAQLIETQSQLAQLKLQTQKQLGSAQKAAETVDCVDASSSSLANSRTSLNNNANNNKLINLNDFSDDLGKVLMSKEEVITQLEKQLMDKEKTIQQLTAQLSEEVAQANKYQDALNHEVNRNNHLKSLNDNLNEQYSCSADEYERLNAELNKSHELVDQLEAKLKQAYATNQSKSDEMKKFQDYAHNELETLQEEIKTLEYKFVHAQRQAQEYQSLLEDMDITNVNTFNQLNQTHFGGNFSSSLNSTPANASDSSNLSSNSIQNKLRKNQIQIQSIMQQLIQQKTNEMENLKEYCMKMKQELDEVKTENIDLNNHIYSIDVYMREKEQLCDQYQKERDDLIVKFNEQMRDMDKQLSEMKKYGIAAQMSDFDLDDNSYYKSFLTSLLNRLKTKTNNFYEFLLFTANICNRFIIDTTNLDPTDLIINYENQFKSVFTLLDSLDKEASISSSSSSSTTLSLLSSNKNESIILNLNDFKRKFASVDATLSMRSVRKFKLTVENLIKFLNSDDLANYNNQIVSYMAEQLVHKAALNGHLKFACEFLRKKHDASCSSQNCSSTKSLLENTNKSSLGSEKNEHDEKIFKLASELLLCDEDLLIKLSAQVLNESQYLTQLRYVLNTLRKIRLNQLSRRLNDALVDLKAISDDEKLLHKEKEEDGDDDNDCCCDESGMGDAENERSYAGGGGSGQNQKSSQLDTVLVTVKDIFMQHKAHISDQLSEVHKLMSISSDEDLFTHLSNENTSLHKEIDRLKQELTQQQLTSVRSSTLTLSDAAQQHSPQQQQQQQQQSVSKPQLNTSPSSILSGSLRRFSNNNNTQLSSTSTSTSSNLTPVSNASTPTKQFNNTPNLNASSKLLTSNAKSTNGQHHILNDLLSQDDTMC